MAPYIEQTGFTNLVDINRSMSDSINEAARKVFMSVYACPSDMGLQKNEWHRPSWARVRANYVVNAGNTCYGQYAIGDFEFLGAPFKPRYDTPLREIHDGTSHTLMMTEVKVVPESSAWGGSISDIQTSLGGQTFTGWNAPNAGQDLVSGPIPPLEDLNANDIPLPCRVPCGLPYRHAGGSKQQVIVARSHHPGSVNASRCDGSVGFVQDSIDEFTWRALTSAAGSETGDGL